MTPEPSPAPACACGHAHGLRYPKTAWIDSRTGELRGGCLRAVSTTTAAAPSPTKGTKR